MSSRNATQVAVLVLIAMTVFAFACTQQGNEGTTSSNTASDALDRTSLPIKEPARQIYKELDARNAKAPPRWEVKAPQGAPNVVVVLIDDIGFGASRSFGGRCCGPDGAHLELGHAARWIERWACQAIDGLFATPVEWDEHGVFANRRGDFERE